MAVSRTRVRVTRVAVIALAVAGTALLAGRAAGSQEATALPRGTTRHLVKAGDTLWEIARARVGAEGDPRPLVAAIEDLNGLDSAELRAGQGVLVPPAP